MNIIKLIIFFLFLIIGLDYSFAFIVQNYDGVQSYFDSLQDRRPALFYSLSSIVKNNIASIKVTFNDNTEQTVNGYANDKSVIIFTDLLNSVGIKTITYFYNDKQIVMKDIRIISKQYNRSFVSITSDTSEDRSNILKKFTPIFSHYRKIREICCESVNYSISKKKSEIIKTHPYDNYLDFINYYSTYKTNLTLTFKRLEDIDSWYIIGKVKDNIDTRLEVIPLMFVFNRISLNSLHTPNDKFNLFIIVDPIVFSDEDVGAYLVYCSQERIVLNLCTVFGQIVKVFPTSGSDKILVIGVIYDTLFHNKDFSFQAYDIHHSEIPKVITSTESAQSTSTITDINTDLSDKQSMKRPLDDSLLGEDYKKQKLDFNEYLDTIPNSLSCAYINEEGLKDFGNNISIYTKQEDAHTFFIQMSDRYIIQGTYTKDKQSKEFNLCKDIDKGIELFSVIDGKEELIVRLIE